jgi:hypothetical protein
MNEEHLHVYTQDAPEKPKENVLFGIVGAFLFALVGGILYYVLYQIGFLASISGLVCVICAIKGYSFFAKRESIRGIVISIIIAVLVLTIAWYICLANDVYLAHLEWFANGEIDFTLTFFESIRYAYLFLPDVPAYFADLGISLLLGAVGCFGYVKQMLQKQKAPAPGPAAAPASEFENSDQNEQQ